MRKNLLNMSDSALDKAVKIQGTNKDRRRKITKWDYKKVILPKVAKGVSLSQIAKELDVDPRTIRYTIDKEYKELRNKNRKFYKKSAQKPNALAERAEYKRELVRNKTKLERWVDKD